MAETDLLAGGWKSWQSDLNCALLQFKQHNREMCTLVRQVRQRDIYCYWNIVVPSRTKQSVMSTRTTAFRQRSVVLDAKPLTLTSMIEHITTLPGRRLRWLGHKWDIDGMRLIAADYVLQISCCTLCDILTESTYSCHVVLCPLVYGT